MIEKIRKRIGVTTTLQCQRSEDLVSSMGLPKENPAPIAGTVIVLKNISEQKPYIIPSPVTTDAVGE